MQEVKHLKWVVHSSGCPTVIKYCPKCGRENHYANSEKFRVNANKKNLDIWLIYTCQSCDDTFNLSIYERIKPSTLSAERLEGFMNNQKELALQYGFDNALHKRASLKQDYSQLDIQISGALPEQNQVCYVSLHAEQSLNLRLDWVLSQKLRLSRNQVKQLMDNGHIALEENSGKALEKLKLNRQLTLRIEL